MAFVDRGYKGAEIDGVQIWKSGQRRGVTRGLKATHDQAAQCDRTDDRAYEVRWQAGAKLTQRCAWGRHACSSVRRWSQHAHHPEKAAAFLCPVVPNAFVGRRINGRQMPSPRSAWMQKLKSSGSTNDAKDRDQIGESIDSA